MAITLKYPSELGTEITAIGSDGWLAAQPAQQAQAPVPKPGAPAKFICQQMAILVIGTEPPIKGASALIQRAISTFTVPGQLTQILHAIILTVAVS